MTSRDPDLGGTFVAGFHAARPGITEDLLTPARDRAGRSPYGWLGEVLPAVGTVLDLACGSAPVADLVGAERYVGVDRSAEELAEARRRRPGLRLVLADVTDTARSLGAFAAVTVSMALMLLGLDECLRTVGRLGAGDGPPGVLAAIVPVRGEAVAGTAYGRVLELLGQRGRAYPDPLDPRTVADRASALGWTLAGDELGSFDRPLRGNDVDLVLSSFYAVGAGENELGAAHADLSGLARGREALAYPVRRIVLRPVR